MLFLERKWQLMRGKDFAFLEWKALQIKTVHTLEGAVRNCGLFWEPYRGTPAWRVHQNKATWAQPAWARLLKLFTDIKSLWAVTTSCYLGRMYVVWSDTERHVRWNLEGLGVFQEAERIWYDRGSSPLHIQGLQCSINVLWFWRKETARSF